MGAPEWKERLLAGALDGSAPEGYVRDGEVIGRAELMEPGGSGLWTESEFVARANLPNTTSAAEAAIRRRELERLVEDSAIDRAAPTLELGCADGLVTHALLELGFEQLVSSDLVHATVAKLAQSLDQAAKERVLLIVDDLMRLPFAPGEFSTVIAWGVLSVSGDFDRALELAWQWLAPGGTLLLAEPVLESVLVYALVRGDLDEFRRILREGTRPGVWENRGDPEQEDRYTVNRMGFYEQRLEALPGAEIVETGGVNMLPSLVLGGLTQDSPVPDSERAELAELLADPELDELKIWRQAVWLLRKR